MRRARRCDRLAKAKGNLCSTEEPQKTRLLKKLTETSSLSSSFCVSSQTGSRSPKQQTAVNLFRQWLAELIPSFQRLIIFSDLGICS